MYIFIYINKEIYTSEQVLNISWPLRSKNIEVTFQLSKISIHNPKGKRKGSSKPSV